MSGPRHLTANDDNVTVDAPNQEVFGDGGNDIIDARFDPGFQLSDWGSVILHGGDGNDTLFGGPGLANPDGTTNDGNDTLFGDAGNDTLTGGQGKDDLVGGIGDDVLNANGGGGVTLLESDSPSDTVSGGDGNDTIILNYAGFVIKDPLHLSDPGTPASVTIDLSTGGGQVHVSGLLGEIIDTVEIMQFSGAEGADVVTAGDHNDSIAGNGGNDIIKAGGGDDFISDAYDHINIDGGSGNDRLVLGPNNITDDVVIDATTGSGTLTVGGADFGTFANIEHLDFTGGTGNDTITGLTDLYSTQVSQLFGNAGDDVITSGDSATNLDGGAGNDTLNGGKGNDTLTGGADRDIIHGGNGDDNINVDISKDLVAGEVYDGGGGNDTLNISSQTSNPSIIKTADFTTVTISGIENFVFAGPFETNYNLTMSSALLQSFASVVDISFSQVTFQLADNSSVALTGLEKFFAIQLADGGQTIDTTGVAAGSFAVEVLGGSGDDHITNVSSNAFGGGGNDVITGGGTLQGNQGDDTLTVTNPGLFTSTLQGGIGNDTLTGGAGNDSLAGGAGDDTLNGGGGVNTLSYFDSTSGVTINLTTKTASGADAAGDVINYSTFTNLTGGTGSDMLTGDANANTITGGGGNDTLIGMAGNDKITGGSGNDVLDGGAGNDDMNGVGGNDTYVYNGQGADRITTAFSGGAGVGDVIKITSTYTTFAQVQAHSTVMGNNTVINFGGGNSLTLISFHSAFNADDFTFATVDNTAPTVSSLKAAPTAGTFHVDNAVDVTFTLTLSEAVNVIGAPVLKLNDGGTAVYSGGTGTSALTFTYTVGAGQNTSALAATGIDLAGGSIEDAAGNDAVLTKATGTFANIHVDTLAPTITKVASTPATGSFAAGTVVKIVLTTSEVVTVGGVPTLSLNDGGTATYLSGSGTTALTFTTTITTGQNASALQITGVNLPGGATVHDAAGNQADLSGAAVTLNNVRVDTTAPTVHGASSVPDHGGIIGLNGIAIIKIDMGEALKVTGSPSLSLSDGGTATFLAASSDLSHGILAFSYKATAIQTSSDLSINPVVLASGVKVTDLAGKAADFTLNAFADLGLTVDTTVPTVSSVGSLTAANTRIPLGQSIEIDVHTSEVVNVANAAGLTLKLSDGGVATYVSGSGSDTLAFLYTAAAGQNTTAHLKTTGLVLANGATVTDAAGNALTIAGAANQDVGVVIDTNAPTVSKVTATASSGKTVLVNGDVVTITLTLKDATAGDQILANSPPDLTLSNGGIAHFFSDNLTTGTFVFKYTVGNEGTTDLRISDVNLSGVTDAAGNTAVIPASLADLKLTTNVHTFIHKGGGDFDAAGNWLPATIPGAGSVALLTTAGTVTTSTDNSVGALTVAAGVALDIQNHQFSVSGIAAAPVINAGTIIVDDGSTLRLTSSAISGKGTITLKSTGDDTILDLLGTNTFSGGGKVILGDNVHNIIEDSVGHLTNVDFTISGAGVIGNNTPLIIENQTKGIINATSATNALTINATQTVTNAGLMEATGAGGLIIDVDTVDNTGGTVLASGANAHVDIHGADITGGTFKTTGNGAVINVTTVNGSLDGVTNSGALHIVNGAKLNIIGSTFNNTATGVITIDGASDTELDFSGNTTLQGGGKINMSGPDGDILALNGGLTFTNADNTIAGSGVISNFDVLVNSAKGTINGNDNAHQLFVTPNALTNSGILEGTAGGAGGLYIGSVVANSNLIEALGVGARVELQDATINNTSTGKIVVSGVGAHVDMDTSSISGGSLSVAKGSILNGVASTLDASTKVTNAGTISANGGNLTIGAAFANTGILDANNGHLTLLGAIIGAGTATIEGVGTIEFGAASSTSVTFAADAIGTLKLDSSSLYTGKVIGWSRNDGLDLTDINFATAQTPTYSGTAASGILTVTDGVHTAKIALVGDYLNNTFQAFNDGSGHAIISIIGQSFAGNDGVADTFIAGPGLDHFNVGGIGFDGDTVSYANSSFGVTVDLSIGSTAQTSNGDANGDSLPFIQNLIGSSHDDILTGGAGSNNIKGGLGNDIIEGEGGADVLTGGGGTDTLSYAHDTAGVTVTLVATKAAVVSGGDAAGDTATGFVNVIGGSGDDKLTGDTGINTISGGDGDDVIDGGAGHDILHGGAGNDTVSYASATTAVTVTLGANGELNSNGGSVKGGALGDTGDGFENILGSKFNDILTGNGLANVIDGGAGNDTISGGGGADSLIGGLGNDSFLIVNDDFHSIDGGAGVDRLVQTGSGHQIALADQTDADRVSSIEAIDLTGSGNNSLTISKLGVDTITDADSHSVHTLTVTGNAGDSLTFDDAGWSKSGGTVGGFDTYISGVTDKILVSHAVTATGVGTGTFHPDNIGAITPTQGFIVQGASAGANAGTSVSSAGDVNGDGFSDFIIGAPQPAGVPGEAYVVFGHAGSFGTLVGGQQVFDLNGFAAADGFIVKGIAGDGIGMTVSSAGDINGDGYDDLLLGASTSDPGGHTNAGGAYVLFGHASGFGTTVNGQQIVDLSGLSASDGFALTGDKAGDRAGYSVASAGDINGDGFDDLLIGAPFNDDNQSISHPSTGANNGDVYVILGKASGFGPVDLSHLLPTDGYVIEGLYTYISHALLFRDQAGFSVAGAGDINGDGFADILIGATEGFQTNAYSRQLAYVVLGTSIPQTSIDTNGRAVEKLSDLVSNKTAFNVTDGNQSPYAGFSVSHAGDVNGDGFDDYIVAAPGAGYQYQGEVVVAFGKSTGLATVNGGAITPSQGFIIAGVGAYDTLGYSVSAAGDFNGDGFADIIVGTPFDNGRGTYSGAAYVIFGKASGFGTVVNGRAVVDVSHLAPSDGFALGGTAAGDQAGTSVTAIGDINGDGFTDLLIGAPYNNAGGTKAGAAYILYGDAEGATVVTTGDANANILIGTSGNDTLTGNGGADAFHGGAGDDLLIVSDLSFRHVDGGAGLDTLELSGANLALDLTNGAVSGKIENIERIDITGSGNNSLTLNALSVLDHSEVDGSGVHVLKVFGDAGDSVIFSEFQWAHTGSVTDSDGTFTIYSLGNAEVEVEQGVTVQFETPVQLGALTSAQGSEFDSSALQAGTSVAGLGDINGDGFADVIIGASEYGANDNGEAYVVFGSAAGVGSISNLHSISPAAGFVLKGKASDYAGASVASAGDVNGDGFDDIIIGAPHNSDAFPASAFNQAGAAYLVFGHASGFGTYNATTHSNVVDLSNLAASDGVELLGAYQTTQAGQTVAGIGDINGDGFADFAVASPTANHAYIIFGSDDPLGTVSGGHATFNLETFTQDQGFVITSDANDLTGQSIVSAGDVNGDGFDDLLIGAGGVNNHDSYDGAAYLLFGSASGFGSHDNATGRDNVVNLSSLTPTEGFVLQNPHINSARVYEGFSVSSADVNGDGFSDMIIGTKQNANQTYVVFGHDGADGTDFGSPSGGRAIDDLSTLNGTNGFIIVGENVLDRAGYSVSSAGDFNGDGFNDIIVGAPTYGDDNQGGAYLIFGTDQGFGATVDLGNLSPSQGFQIVGPAGAQFQLSPEAGTSVSAAGDLNGDGFADLIIGVPGLNGFQGGAYILYGAAFGATITTAGTAADEMLIGGSGNDTLTGGGGHDVFHGGAGNDTLTVPDLNFRLADGGSGTDKLVLSGSSNFDFDSDPTVDAKIQSIEAIDLGASGNRTLALGVHAVLDFSGSPNVDFTGATTANHTLVIYGDGTDHLNLHNDAAGPGPAGTWAKVANQVNLDGTGTGAGGFDFYDLTQNGHVTASVAVDHHIQLMLV